MIIVEEKKCQVPQSETNKKQYFILFTLLLQEMTLSLFSQLGRLPEGGYLLVGSWKGLGFDKCRWMRQKMTGVWEQTEQNFGVWKAGATVKVLKSKEIPSRTWALLLRFKKKKKYSPPLEWNLTILTFKRSNFKILCVWENLLIDRIQKFTETRVLEGSYYLYAKPKGKSRFKSWILNQSLK